MSKDSRAPWYRSQDFQPCIGFVSAFQPSIGFVHGFSTQYWFCPELLNAVLVLSIAFQPSIGFVQSFSTQYWFCPELFNAVLVLSWIVNQYFSRPRQNRSDIDQGFISPILVLSLALSVQYWVRQRLYYSSTVFVQYSMWTVLVESKSSSAVMACPRLNMGSTGFVQDSSCFCLRLCCPREVFVHYYVSQCWLCPLSPRPVYPESETFNPIPSQSSLSSHPWFPTCTL